MQKIVLRIAPRNNGRQKSEADLSQQCVSSVRKTHEDQDFATSHNRFGESVQLLKQKHSRFHQPVLKNDACRACCMQNNKSSCFIRRNKEIGCMTHKSRPLQACMHRRLQDGV